MILDKLFSDYKKENIILHKDYPIINISNEIWLAFVQEVIKWNCKDIYAISFYIDIDENDYPDTLLYFGYNTASQYKSELCKDFDDNMVRWDYNFWLQNELFCFGEDGTTNQLIKIWIKQQKIDKKEVIGMLVEHIIYAIYEIHKCKIIENHFGKEFPIIIHTKEYHKNIAKINIEANGKYIDNDFIKYCNN